MPKVRPVDDRVKVGEVWVNRKGMKVNVIRVVEDSIWWSSPSMGNNEFAVHREDFINAHTLES